MRQTYPLSSPCLLTSSQFKHLPSLLSVFSHQVRRQIPRNATASALSWWRRYRCSSLHSNNRVLTSQKVGQHQSNFCRNRKPELGQDFLADLLGLHSEDILDRFMRDFGKDNWTFLFLILLPVLCCFMLSLLYPVHRIDLKLCIDFCAW